MVGVFAFTQCESNRDLGKRNYGDNCGICHHGGQGQAGETPALFGRVDQIAQTPEGHRYLINVLLNGINGPITANGQHFDFSMPAFRHLSDADIAHILNYITSKNSPHPAPRFTPQDIAAQRTPIRASSDVHDLRDKLNQTQPIP